MDLKIHGSGAVPNPCRAQLHGGPADGSRRGQEQGK